MGTDHIHMDAYYDAADNIVVTITSDKDAFYAMYTVGDEINAEITYGDSSDSGESFNDFYQTFEFWYTYYDVDGNQFEVHNYYNEDSSLNGNQFIQVVDGQEVDTYYQWYDNLSEDLYNNDGMGYSVYNSYENEVYVSTDNYQAYYWLADDASYSYYLSEFYADDGTYRSTEGNDDNLVSHYISADGYFESYYTWMTQTYVTFYNDFYTNYVAEDGLYGEYLYEDPSKTYWVSGSWSIVSGTYFWYEQDSYGENISGSYDADYWTFYDAYTDVYSSGGYNYYSQTTNEFGVTTTTYRAKDGSDWSVVDNWTDDEGHEVIRTFSADGTRTYSYSVDGTHYYMTDLVTGIVTITPETYGEIIEDDIIHFVYEGESAYLAIGIDEDLDAIVMDGLNENEEVLEAYIYRSTPWTSTVTDINGNDVMNVIASEFDTIINDTFDSAY